MLDYQLNNFLSQKSRQKLVDIVVDEALFQKLERRNTTYDVLANKIVELFPNEDKVCKYVLYLYNYMYIRSIHQTYGLFLTNFHILYFEHDISDKIITTNLINFI